ncbi:helix-turn-helix domain-containing protein [Actinomadura sp. NBRC 104425]|uniref:AraC-like ligand-binding domain-containing protein n=1 Tax=Actinomadura sp. NBRC 104425 TaxID=3032204 RepID=UPI0025553DE9|nr:helix-turn-helix domain-containing protein [Actinomadura sp. NBRC 104425]
MYQSLTLNDLPARDRFALWRETVASAVAPVPYEIRSDHADEFDATMHVLNLGAVQISAHIQSPIHVRRTAKLIRQSDSEHYHLTLVRRGTTNATQAGRDTTVGPGDLMLHDTWRPFHGTHTGDRRVDGIQVMVPRKLIPLPPDQVGRLCAVRVPGREGVGGLLVQFLNQVTRNAGTYRPADAARLGGVCVDLLTAVLAHRLETEHAVPHDSRKRTLLLRIHAFIERSLGDPELSPGLIAAAHHISLRSLHRLFAEQGTTVSDWIRTRRLEQCRRELASVDHRHLAIHTIAARWGYTHPGNFTRAFHAAYGLTPSAYRRNQEAHSASGQVLSATSSMGEHSSAP